MRSRPTRGLGCFRAPALLAALGVGLLAWSGVPALAQGITSGNLSGVVTAAEDGSRIPGVTLTAVHEPTGTTYTTTTRSDGTFSIHNVRVGPYAITAQLEGFSPAEVGGIEVNLAQTANVRIQLGLETVEETITVTSQYSPLISPTRMGATSNVSTGVIESLPTINRSLTDFARTDPLFNNQSTDNPQAFSVAGRNNRYNNIQIDGAVNNDLFGLADTGTPGGQTETQPISLDAIEEIQLEVSPYDVRHGGFTGGAINAITRSGGNRFTGSVFYFDRDDGLVGDGPDVLGEFGTFDEQDYGFRLGGPIVEDTAFFFVNGEISDKDEPTGFSLNGQGGQAFANGELVDEAQLFEQTLIERYGFDPGGLDQQVRTTESDTFFGRLDFNLGDSNQLTLRHNYVDASNLVNFPGSRSYEWDSEAYTITDETNSTVAQLNTTFTSSTYNEARLTYQTIEDRRGGDVAFPHIEVEDVDPSLDSRFEFEAGTEQFSTRNSLDQEIIEITDNFTWVVGDHTVVIGTHNELFSFENLFVQDAFGSYEFFTLDDFLAGEAWRFRHTFANPGQDPVARFDVDQLGLYAGDTWSVRPDLTLTYGLRVDAPFFPDEPGRNPVTEELYGVRTDEIPDGEQMWSPRLGFNWDIGGDANDQLRGGAGIFSGRMPYVWFSNNYSRNGLVFTQLEVNRFDLGEPIPFNPDPFAQPTSFPAGTASTGEFNLIDADFEFPQVTRYTLAYDRDLPWLGLTATIEGIYAQSEEEILYQDLNLTPTGETVPFDGRPVFTKVDPSVSGAYFLTNTSEGEQTNLAVKLERPYRNGWWAFASYTYGDSEVVNDGTSSRAVSNFQFNEAVDPNDPGTSVSDFQVEHRFNAGLSYLFEWGDGWGTTAALFYNHQSGRPYSTILGFQCGRGAVGVCPPGGINNDFYFFNDLFYVPSGPDDVIIVNGTWEQLDAYIASDDGLDDHRGGIAPRNTSQAPWSHSLDLRLAQDIPVAGTTFQVTFDIFNLMNLIDEDSGVVRFARFNAVAPVDYLGYDEETGKPIYSLDGIVTDPENNEKFTIDNLASRWRAKLGVRFSF